MSPTQHYEKDDAEANRDIDAPGPATYDPWQWLPVVRSVFLSLARVPAAWLGALFDSSLTMKSSEWHAYFACFKFQDKVGRLFSWFLNPSVRQVSSTSEVQPEFPVVDTLNPCYSIHIEEGDSDAMELLSLWCVVAMLCNSGLERPL